MIKYVNKIFNRFNLEVRPTAEKLPLDIESETGFKKIYNKCRPFTMTSAERMYSLYQSIKYVITNDIPGDIVECGVWKGGSSMVIAETLLELGITDRALFLYDTFQGMNEPTDKDISVEGKKATVLLQSQKKEDINSIWCYSTIDEVKQNMALTKYPSECIHFVEGKVEDTIPERMPTKIALLRLDTDWYESTKHELIHLYPILSQSGVLIIDDFGFWQGAKKAVLEYFSEMERKPLLSRIDLTGRLLIKL